MVARAEPDGHTLLFTTDDTFTLIPRQLASLSFDPMTDLVPVNLSVKSAILIVENPTNAVGSIAALIARARENPGRLIYASWGTGGGAHLAMETFKSLANVDILHVPYKGVAPMMTAVVAGEVQLALTGYGTAAGLFEAGRIKPLAVASPERVAQLPDTPTMREVGYGDVDATVWWGLAAPAKTPSKIVNQIHAAVSRVLNSAETRQAIEGRSLVITDLGPKPFAEQLNRESHTRAEALRRFGIRPK
jgi:tripartite-type tricarboxylate transporter receptor subunit TctC